MLSGAARPFVVDRAVYGTITIMSVLIVYDGWETLRLVGVVAVILGPIIAMFLSHVFSASIAEQVKLERSLTNNERIAVVRSESRFLLLAVPPAVIAVVLNLAGLSLTTCIRVTLLFGVASLGFWGGLAGRRAGFAGRRLMLAVLAGLIVGVLILTVQVILQPGKALTNGVV
jgi:hypothetical protein